MTKMHHIVTNFETGEVRTEPMKARTRAEAIAEFQRLLDDCPECQALRARGEVPQMVRISEPFTSAARLRRPRWRDLKRRVRR